MQYYRILFVCKNLKFLSYRPRNYHHNHSTLPVKSASVINITIFNSRHSVSKSSSQPYLNLLYSVAIIKQQLCFFSFQKMLARELIRLTTLISLIIFTNCLGGSPLEIVKQWDLLSYDFPPDWPVNDKTLYNPEQIVATGFEIGDDKIFIANPRLFSGVPATISSVSRDSVGDSPVLKVCFFVSFVLFTRLVFYLR